MKKTLLTLAALALTLGLALPPAQADDVTDQLERGLKLYKEGKITEALSEVDFAAAQMRQKKAELLVAVFPPAPAGWKAEKPETQAMGRSMFGGGISAAQGYKQEKGQGRVKLEVISDSPILQGVAMMLTNPMLIQGSGNKLIRIGDEKAVMQGEGKSRVEVQMVVDNKVLVKTEVSGLDNGDEVAKDFAAKIDLKKLRELNQ